MPLTLGMLAASGSIPLSISYISAASSSGNAGTYSFSMNLGSLPPSGKRRFLFALCGALQTTGGFSITSASIGGVSGSSVQSVGGSTSPAHIFYSEVPSGTSGTVSFSCSTTANGGGILLYSVISGPDGITIGTTGVSSSTTSPVNFTPTVQSGGAVISMGMSRSSSANNFSWTGITKNAEIDVNSSDMLAGASLATTTSGALSVSASSSGSVTSRSLIIASINQPP